MYVDDKGIVRFESLDTIAPLQVGLNAAMESVSDAITSFGEEVEDNYGHLLGDTGWVPITFETGFESYGGNYDVAIRRKGDLVKMSGLVRATSGTLPTTQTDVGVIPFGFIPTTNLSFAVGTTTGRATGTVFVTNGGNIQWRPGPTSAGTYFGMDGLNWWVD